MYLPCKIDPNLIDVPGGLLSTACQAVLSILHYSQQPFKEDPFIIQTGLVSSPMLLSSLGDTFTSPSK